MNEHKKRGLIVYCVIRGSAKPKWSQSNNSPRYVIIFSVSPKQHILKCVRIGNLTNNLY